MRTTLEIDNDLVPLLKRLAEQQGTTMGQTASDLMRKGLEPRRTRRYRNGVPILIPAKREKRRTLDIVNQLRDDA